MKQEEIKELLKFIIRKCDLVINNENYTADEYAQDKIEDIAEICHRVLDGQFGEIIETSQPSLPTNLDETVMKIVSPHIPWGDFYTSEKEDLEDWLSLAGRAGAEWMAGQGVKAHCIESANPVSESPDARPHLITLLYEENEHTPYVRAGDDIDIIIRKK